MVDQNLNAQHVSTHTPHMLPVLFFCWHNHRHRIKVGLAAAFDDQTHNVTTQLQDKG